MDAEIFELSDRFVDELFTLVDLPLQNDSDRFVTSDMSCSLSFEL
jgi:hypothetical protein